MSRLVNTTPHDINVVLGNGGSMVLPKSENPARCVEIETGRQLFRFGDDLVHVVKKEFGAVENLPEPVEGTFFVVSAIVKQALPSRKDLLLVNDTVRNEKGQIVGCRSFAR